MRLFSKGLAVLLAVTACSGDPLAEAGIECEPMAYQYENQVWVLTEGNRNQLTSDDEVGANPVVSHDGKRVAFTAGPEEDLDLFVMGTDGSVRTLVWAGDSLQSAADWSFDDSAIVFDGWFDENGMQVFAIDLDGSEPEQLTTGEANAKPKWSSDRKTIYFLSLRDGPWQEIYAMNSDGSDQLNLTNDPAIDVLAEPSPDGTRIAFVSDRSGNFDIWLMDPDGSNRLQLTTDGQRDWNPTWSTDGEHIIFRSDRDPVGLWSMRADGSGQTPILDDGWLASCP